MEEALSVLVLPVEGLGFLSKLNMSLKNVIVNDIFFEGIRDKPLKLVIPCYGNGVVFGFSILSYDGKGGLECSYKEIEK